MAEDIEGIRRTILDERFAVWSAMLDHLDDTKDPDHSVVRFPNSSTYVFSTGAGTFWIVDPSYSMESCPEEDMKRIADRIRERFSFILVTHLHNDHCQPEFIRLLADSPIRWVVSERFLKPFSEMATIPENRLLVLKDGDTAEFSGIRAECQRGYHNEPGKPGVPSCSYDVRLPDGVRLFFPADVRDYQAEIPGREQPVDYTFGHVFLGREDACGDRFSELDSFCRFMTARKCSVLILAHLYSTGRLARDLWTHRHAGMIRDKLRISNPELQVIAPRYGDVLRLIPGR